MLVVGFKKRDRVVTGSHLNCQYIGHIGYVGYAVYLTVMCMGVFTICQILA